MNDKIIKIEFNIWGNNDKEEKLLRQKICEFINWHGERGVKVNAKKIIDAINKWQNNGLIRNTIFNYFK